MCLQTLKQEPLGGSREGLAVPWALPWLLSPTLRVCTQALWGGAARGPVPRAACPRRGSSTPSCWRVSTLMSLLVLDQRLLDETRALSEAVFGEDCLRGITKKSKWQLTLLVSADQAEMFGFIVTKSVNGSLAIAKLAVSSECRRMGLGKHLMEEVMKAAKKRGDIYEVCLSSLATAVSFYQRLGFNTFKDMRFAVDFEVEEGQVYMEKKLRPRPRRK
ncbi:unnamed protein product [Prorocentrum cordatum]|uniref:Glucosamine 6-phosphate N-acetyltransferase n=1 Tax=Prorocentrum cordatum TaxID=2364126 RepID=A0ABN9XJQ9_9DINO|nr:unnamed protein product [Polarella glacialis]